MMKNYFLSRRLSPSSLSNYWLLMVAAALLSAFSGLVASKAHAANVNYNTEFNVTITSPAVTLVIPNTSVADKVSIYATSVIVDVSTSTAGSFIIAAAQSNFTVTTSSGPGTGIAISCRSDATAIVTITVSGSNASSTYIVTPTGTKCSPPATGSHGGGVAISNVEYTPSPAPTPTPTSTVVTVTPSVPTSPADKLKALLDQLQKLQTQLQTQGSENAAVTVPVLKKDLQIGSKGVDVTGLQTWLVAKGYLTMPKGVAYGYFGGLTKAALQKYQKANGVSATGYFGPKTRATIK